MALTQQLQFQGYSHEELQIIESKQIQILSLRYFKKNTFLSLSVILRYGRIIKKGFMGSSCSIKNDTEFDIWIYEGINYRCLIPVVGGVVALLTVGIGLAVLGATAGVGGVLLGGGALIVSEEGIIMGATALTIVGLTAGQWTMVGIVTGVSSSALSTILGITQAQAEDLQKYVEDFQKSAKKISPGESYVWSGTLSLNKRVYVMNDMLQVDDHACWTGPTANSTNYYTISEYFKKLKVHRDKFSTIKVPAH